MPKDRGDYDTFYRSMPDSEEFEALSIGAAAVLTWGLKLARANNITGIFVIDREATARRSKVPLARLSSALDELERGRWIVREDPDWVWIRNQLRFNPSFSPANERQVKGVFGILDGITKPRLVAAFVRYYQAQEYLPADLAAWVPHKKDLKTGKPIPDPAAGRRATANTVRVLARYPNVTVDTLHRPSQGPSDSPCQDPWLSLPTVSVSVSVSDTVAVSVTETVEGGREGGAPPVLRVVDPERTVGAQPTSADPDHLATWRRADGRTLGEIADEVARYAEDSPHDTAEAVSIWCAEHGAPDTLVPLLLTAIDQRPRRDIPDDFGPGGDRARLLSEGQPLVEFIASTEQLDETEVCSKVTEWKDHGGRVSSYITLDRIPPNRHARLVHTVNGLRKWARRLQGLPEPTHTNPEPTAPARTATGRTMQALARAAQRRGIDVRQTQDTGAGAARVRVPEVAIGAGRGMPAGTQRSGLRELHGRALLPGDSRRVGDLRPAVEPGRQVPVVPEGPRTAGGPARVQGDTTSSDSGLPAATTDAGGGGSQRAGDPDGDQGGEGGGAQGSSEGPRPDQGGASEAAGADLDDYDIDPGLFDA